MFDKTPQINPSWSPRSQIKLEILEGNSRQLIEKFWHNSLQRFSGPMGGWSRICTAPREEGVCLGLRKGPDHIPHRIHAHPTSHLTPRPPPSPSSGEAWAGGLGHRVADPCGGDNASRLAEPDHKKLRPSKSELENSYYYLKYNWDYNCFYFLSY